MCICKCVYIYIYAYTQLYIYTHTYCLNEITSLRDSRRSGERALIVIRDYVISLC